MDQTDSPHELALATARLLSSETRLRLLHLLRRQGEGRALCVNALAHRLGVSQAAVSQHLRRFEEVGLLHRRETGVQAHYFLDEAAVHRCRNALNLALGESKSDDRPEARE